MSSSIARTTAVLLAAFVLPTLPFLVVGELPGDRWLSARDENSLEFATIGAALLTVDIVLPVPSSVVGSLLGARLGLPIGFLATWLGLVAGNLLGWAAGRLVLGRFEAEVPVAPTAWIVFASRSVPVVAEGITVASGASRMPLRVFSVAVVAGNACYAGILVAVGVAMVGSRWAGPLLALPLLLAGAAVLLWRSYARAPAA